MLHAAWLSGTEVWIQAHAFGPNVIMFRPQRHIRVTDWRYGHFTVSKLTVRFMFDELNMLSSIIPAINTFMPVLEQERRQCLIVLQS